MNMHTKAQEIAILISTAATLGQDSYTGPWLSEQIPQINAAINADMPAETRALTYSEAAAQARQIIADAKAKAAQIMADADAHQKKAAAQTYAELQRFHAIKKALADAQKDLETQIIHAYRHA